MGVRLFIIGKLVEALRREEDPCMLQRTVGASTSFLLTRVV